MYYREVTAEIPTMTDEAAALGVQKGDIEVFGTLMNRYEEKLLRYGRKFLSEREDIQDIVQDVFLSAYQNIQGFDTTQRFSPWIYRIAHNAFVNALGKKSRSPLRIDFDTFFPHPVYDDPVESEREQKDMRTMIDRGLDTVSVKYKEILVLHYFEELPYKDIAEILEVPLGTVGIRLKRAKEALKKNLQEKIQ